MLVRRAGVAVAALTLLGSAAATGAAPASASTSAAVVAAASAASGDDCLQVGQEPRDKRTVSGENAAQVDLHVPQAQDLVRRSHAPGAGITVIVVDSGIGGLAEAAPVGRPAAELQSGHGLAVAGVIAGRDQPAGGGTPAVRVGFAPAATLVDAPFYAAPYGEGEDGSSHPTAAALTAVLQAVRGRAGRHTIVVVPAEVPATPALRAAVAGVVRAGALVVAAAGDRPPAEAGSPFDDLAADQPKPGEEVAGTVWPAADQGVLAVGTSAPEGRALALRNSDVDVAAPGRGAVSVARDGGWCVIGTASTHWATAEVAGIAALVWSAFPGESAARIRTRLEETASGNGAASSPVTGRGVVQPLEALQRLSAAELPPRDETEVVDRATPPPEKADLLADTRHDAVWWGLAGGAALLVLLLLRPVLARHRR